MWSKDSSSTTLLSARWLWLPSSSCAHKHWIHGCSHISSKRWSSALSSAETLSWKLSLRFPDSWVRTNWCSCMMRKVIWVSKTASSSTPESISDLRPCTISSSSSAGQSFPTWERVLSGTLPGLCSQIAISTGGPNCWWLETSSLFSKLATMAASSGDGSSPQTSSAHSWFRSMWSHSRRKRGLATFSSY